MPAARASGCCAHCESTGMILAAEYIPSPLPLAVRLMLVTRSSMHAPSLRPGIGAVCSDQAAAAAACHCCPCIAACESTGMILAAECIPTRSPLRLMLGPHSGIGNRIPGAVSRFFFRETAGGRNPRFPIRPGTGIGGPDSAGRRFPGLLEWIVLWRRSSGGRPLAVLVHLTAGSTSHRVRLVPYQ
jgi:hypothetical protein